MFEHITYSGSIASQYDMLIKQLDSLLEGETNRTANLANASALLNQFLDNVNWVGFYEYINGELVLGPFQGLPACVRIPNGKGVCGTALNEQQVVRVADVHKFPGHIACDAASNSEIVLPVFINGEIAGVLDIDSPVKNRFSAEEEEHLTRFVETLSRHL
ncbi:GAF domain-containing protein [Salsuginibacillus kocurii]|uniref:GAF domain-containing protein n=1 Tax=Salsuginibacillus kocurii TaxID=427078 RepID=UPI000373717E|nr:GAF domain-containing protein [Salsuginibacillus kocurii]